MSEEPAKYQVERPENPSTTCNNKLKELGLPYARSCRKCGLGPCVGEPARPQVTVQYDLSPAETESQLRTKLIEMGWTTPGQNKQAEPVACVDNDKVICPACTHQFRAIPVNVQGLLLDAGFEPPFTHPAPAVAAWKSDDEALQIFRKTRGDELTLNMFKEEILNAVNAPAVAQLPADVVRELVEALESLALENGRNTGWEDFPDEMERAKQALKSAKEHGL